MNPSYHYCNQCNTDCPIQAEKCVTLFLFVESKLCFRRRSLEEGVQILNSEDEYQHYSRISNNMYMYVPYGGICFIYLSGITPPKDL